MAAVLCGEGPGAGLGVKLGLEGRILLGPGLGAGLGLGAEVVLGLEVGLWLGTAVTDGLGEVSAITCDALSGFRTRAPATIRATETAG